jgi:hypothetical protein
VVSSQLLGGFALAVSTIGTQPASHNEDPNRGGFDMMRQS